MTYQEKIEKLLQDRAIALSSLSSAYKEEISKTDELDFYYTYLFGSGGNNVGVITILELFYRELYLGIGRTTTRPALQEGVEQGVGTSTGSWKAAFSNAIGVNGDDAEGFYPPDGNNIGDKNFNEGSDYLTTNLDQGETEGGIVSTLIAGSAVRNAIGTSAILGPHTEEPSTSGSGILGKRTEDNLPADETDPDPLNWTYGDGTPDNPDWYNTPYKANFESALQDIIDDLGIYKTHLETTRGILEYIEGENGISNHEVFKEASMSNDMPLAEIGNLSILENTIQDHINNLQDELDYFSGFTASDNLATGQTQTYDRAIFDGKLNTAVPELLTDIRTTLQGREAAVKTAINYDDTNGNFRKWIVFWIKQAIGKFDGALISLNGIENDVIPNNEVGLGNANEALVVLFGTEYEKFLVPPTVFAAFFNPVIDEETGDVIEKKVGIVWMANLAANRYNIYRKKVDNLTTIFNNETQWATADEINQHTEMNDKNTMIKTEYVDNDAALQDGGLFVYRVKSFDTNTSPKAWDRLDTVLGIDTSSQQSNIVGDTFTIASIEGNIVNLTEEPANNFGVCFIDNKYYGVLKVKKEKIILAEEVIGTPSVLIEIKGGVFVP